MAIAKKIQDYFVTLEQLVNSTTVPMGAVITNSGALDAALQGLAAYPHLTLMRGLQTDEISRVISTGKILVFDLRQENELAVRNLLAMAQNGSLSLRTTQGESVVIDPLPPGAGFLVLCVDNLPENFEALITSVCRE